MPPPAPPGGGDDDDGGNHRLLLAGLSDADALGQDLDSSSPTATTTSARRHFANVLKGFIGSNYLSVPFAYAAFGMLLGPLATGLVAAVSGACACKQKWTAMQPRPDASA